MEQKDEFINRDLTLTVLLPSGAERTAVVHGSKPMMDLLVMLCAKYHLNPSNHTIELISTDGKHIAFKPNALIGVLDVHTVLLKPRGVDKNKTTLTQVPEATVRLVINYRKTQKSVLRVNPEVALGELLQAVCDKCELEPDRTVLLRDACSEEPLDLTKSLNDCGLREVYAKEVRGNDVTNYVTNSSILEENKGNPQTKDKTPKERENRGLLSMFKRRKKGPEQQTCAASAPASPLPRKQGVPSVGGDTPAYSSNTMPSDMPKKRRAPLPPMMMSQSVPSDLNSHQAPPVGVARGDQVHSGLSSGCSSESSLKRTKRRAPPPPPCAVALDSEGLDSVNAALASEHVLLEIHEQEEVTCLGTTDSCTVTSCDEDDSSLNLSADASLGSGRQDLASDPADFDVRSSLLSEGTEEDQVADLTSDGKLIMESATNKECAEPMQNAERTDISQVDLTACSVSAETDPGLHHQRSHSVENGPLLGMEGKERQAAACLVQQCGPHNLAPPSLASQEPQTQETEVQTSDLQDADASFGDKVEEVGAPAELHGVSYSNGKAGDSNDAEHQPPCLSPDEPAVPGPPRLTKDMATSTEVLCFLESRVTPTVPPVAVNGQLSPHVVTKHPAYVKESKPRPKPSNELTREYTPKVGLTTYTVVPQKTLEKLKIFEVELTLEAPGAEAKLDLAANSHMQSGRCGLAQDRQEPRAAAPRDGCHGNGRGSGGDSPEHSSETQAQQAPLPPVVPKGEGTVCEPPPPPAGGAKLALDPDIKRKKIPPPTKPKPASFHLPLHKRTPVCYITSATVRNVSGGPSRRHGTEQAAWQEGEEVLQEPAAESPPLPPPAVPPPMMLLEQEATGGPQGAGKMLGGLPSEPPLHSHSDAPARQHPAALSLEKLRSFAAPRPYTAVSPSRFALAVSSAVRRSQSLTPRPSIPASAQSGFPSKAHSSTQSCEEPSMHSGNETEGSVGDCEKTTASTIQGTGLFAHTSPAIADTDAGEPREEHRSGACWEDGGAAEHTAPDAQVNLMEVVRTQDAENREGRMLSDDFIRAYLSMAEHDV